MAQRSALDESRPKPHHSPHAVIPAPPVPVKPPRKASPAQAPREKTLTGKPSRKKTLRKIAALLLALGFAACGIEDYPFLDKVPSGNVAVTLNQKASITLPTVDSIYFTHFTLYYRIYVSGTYFPEINTGNMSQLNSNLMADYSYFLPYTDSDTSSSSMGTNFANRKYYALTVEGNDAHTVLGSSGFGKTLTLDFTETTPRIIPNLSIGGISYNLQRSTGNSIFRPVPEDRYFINTAELTAAANITATVNADVADKSDITTRYAYAALYIVVSGVDSYFSPLYSVPTFVGVFYLPSP